MKKERFTIDAWLQNMSRKVVDEDDNSVDPRVCSLGWLLERQDRLFLITPEPELSEFEKGCIRLYQDGRDDGLSGHNLSDESLKECSAELLELARNQLQKEGLVTMEHMNKACEAEYQSGLADGKNETMKEIEQDPESSYAFKRGVEYGKEEALKDLPRWRKYNTPGASKGELSLMLYSGVYEVSDLFIDKGLYIPISDLEKLSGFKEDEK